MAICSSETELFGNGRKFIPKILTAKMDVKLLHFIALAVIAEIHLIGITADDAPTEGTVNKIPPIIIKIPERHYDQPNLADFENCSKDYVKCKESCENLKGGLEDCLKQCPTCPVLVAQEGVVEGFNDTDYRVPSKTSAMNSTHIIRLTNEIHNIIENKLSIVTTENDGKFGLGYNEDGPCCLVIRNKNDEHKRKSCGHLCKARIMIERSIVQCADELDIESCREVFEYKPYRRTSRHAADTRTSSYNRCSYQAEWPYVSCHNRRQNEYCSPQCLELAYGYILRYGIPLHCVDCFKNFNRLGIDAPPLGYSPYIPSDDDNNEDGWILEKTKCRQADGTLRDNCVTEDVEGSGDDDFIFPNNEARKSAAFDAFQSLEPSRQRRFSFRRSKYSRRYRSKNLS